VHTERVEPEPATARRESPAPWIDVIEDEMRQLLSRARSFSVELAEMVHPSLEPALYVLLVQLAELGQVRAVDLANQRGITKGVVSRQIETLESLSLLTRVPDPRDARARVIVLTAEGRRAVRRAQAARRAYLNRLLQECDADELTAIARGLTRLNELIG
jgi:DNA-binding MarR family transcriptional regulator